jgi:hypothetical protein
MLGGRKPQVGPYLAITSVPSSQKLQRIAGYRLRDGILASAPASVSASSVKTALASMYSDTKARNFGTGPVQMNTDEHVTPDTGHGTGLSDNYDAETSHVFHGTL